MRSLCSTCAVVSHSSPTELSNFDRAAPITTRSDCLGSKAAHGGFGDRLGFTAPPVQPGAAPKSARVSTASFADAWPSAVNLICALSATAAATKTSAVTSEAKATTHVLPTPKSGTSLPSLRGGALHHPRMGGSRPENRVGVVDTLPDAPSLADLLAGQRPGRKHDHLGPHAQPCFES